MPLSSLTILTMPDGHRQGFKRSDGQLFIDWLTILTMFLVPTCVRMREVRRMATSQSRGDNRDRLAGKEGARKPDEHPF